MAAPLRFTSLDHISLTVANLQRSLDFYSQLFGANLRKESESDRYYLRLGSSYMAIGQAAQGRRSGYIDHFCAGCEGVWLKPIEDRLKEIGVAYTTPQPFGIFFTDPDGIRIQLWTGDSWLDVARTAPMFTRPSAQSPLLEPVGLASLDVILPDQRKSLPYYSSLFGEPSIIFASLEHDLFHLGQSMLRLHKGTPAALWGASIRVRTLPPGAPAKLQSLGARLVLVDRLSISFTDPDGILLMVQIDGE